MAEAVVARMDTRGKKRKREVERVQIASRPVLVESPSPTLPSSIWAGELESGEGSCDSYTSDAGNANALEDDVVHVANALTKVCAKSPQAVIEFVRRVSPTTVGRSINWDVVHNTESRKMSDGRCRWTDMEVRFFLESCLEEIAAHNIITSNPKPVALDNLATKMYAKCRKKVNRSQVQYIWRDCRKRFNMWVWLESQATGLGCDPHTSAIVADDDWWEQQEGMKKGVMTFKNDPLKHIDLHNAVFRGRTVVGNHSDVAGASPSPAQAQAHWQHVDIAQLTATYMPPMPSVAAPQSSRGKGKRAATDSAASGGSSKKSRSDSTGEALHRLADLRCESLQSRAREAAEAKSKGIEACLELVENDGHRITGLVWYVACRLFQNPNHCACFIRIPTAEDRLDYIQVMSQGGGGAGGAGASSGFQ